MYYESLDVIIDIGKEDLIWYAQLDPRLQNPMVPPQYVPILSNFSPWVLYHLLLCVCRDGHQRGICWDSAFNLSHVTYCDQPFSSSV